MEKFVGAAFALLFLCVSQMLVINATERTKVLLRWRPVLMLIAFVWWGTPLLKKVYVDEFFYPDDSVVHEAHSRDIAYLINEGDWEQLRGYAGMGNEGYRCVVGAFYAVTGAPELTVYEIHGLLAFWGLLCLVEMACAHTRAKKVPLWVLLFCLLNPSALFWTTFNLKEGAMLWGICLTLRAAVNLSDPENDTQSAESLFWPILGILVAGFIRPHIVVAYLAALAIGVAVRRGEVGWAFVAAAGMVGGVAGLKVIAPGLYDSLIADGVSVTLNDKFDELSMTGGSAIVYTRGAPIPLISGIVLLSFRPFPWEASDMQSLAAGAEVWVMMAVGFIGWLTLRERFKLLGSSYTITLLIAFLSLAFYFTYIYNMGLMVRQRVMVFPAMLSFAILPYLAASAKSMTQSLASEDEPPMYSSTRYAIRNMGSATAHYRRPGHRSTGSTLPVYQRRPAQPTPSATTARSRRA